MNSPSPLALKQPKPSLNSSHPTLPFKSPKMKPIFHDKAKWRCRMDSDISYIHKYKPKMVSTVEFESLGYQGNNGIRSLCKALTYTKRVSSFVITEPDYYSENFERLAHLLKITNRWKKLTLKYMNDEGIGYINKEKWKSTTRLRRCKDLSILNISFDCWDHTKNKLLKYLSQQIQGLPNLKTLNIDISACYPRGDSDEEEDDENDSDDNDDDDDPNSPLLKFKYPRSLSFLHLNFQPEGSVNTLLLPTFASNIQQCRFLDHISLDFSSIIYHMESSEAQIWTCLAEKTSSLKTLKMKKTLHNHEFEANKAYLESFQHLKTLENLSLDFYFSLSEQSNQILSPIFFAHLASLTNLKSLDLTLSCNNNHPSFLHLLMFQSFSRLEELRLNLMHCCNMDSESLHSLALLLPYLYNLKQFELILPKSNITDEGIIAFSSGFKQLSQLKSLSLNLKNINVNHEIMERLCNNLTHLNLASLKIILDCQPEAPKSFFQKFSALWESEKRRLTSLFSALYGWNSLENLFLNLSVFEVSTKEFKHFSLALKELKQLKSLSLELPQFDSGNNFEGLGRFLSGLKKLQKLHFLHLAFKGTKLSCKEVELIALNLRDCSRYLENLDLSFEHAGKLGNEVLNYLGLGLQSLRSLKNLSLKFGKQKTFQKEAALDLLESLTVLKELESLAFHLEFPILHSEMKLIRIQMANHQNLKRLTKFTLQKIAWV